MADIVIRSRLTRSGHACVIAPEDTASGGEQTFSATCIIAIGLCLSRMNIKDIEAFVAVAETGSVNRAAIRLNLTQPATTRRIQNFEAAIGSAPLFNRAVKPAVLTSLGTHILEYCRRVLAAVTELEACTAKAA